MHDDVARLVREERLVEAANLARTLGDPRTASELFERACDGNERRTPRSRPMTRAAR